MSTESYCTGFHHIALASANFEKSVDFYMNAIGCKELCRWGEGEGRGIMLDLGDGAIIEIFANGSGEPEVNARFIHFALKTEDAEKAYNKAIAAGAKSKMEPKEIDIQAVPNVIPVKIAFVFGPDGESVEFFQYRS